MFDEYTLSKLLGRGLLFFVFYSNGAFIGSGLVRGQIGSITFYFCALELLIAVAVWLLSQRALLWTLVLTGAYVACIIAEVMLLFLGYSDTVFNPALSVYEKLSLHDRPLDFPIMLAVLAVTMSMLIFHSHFNRPRPAPQ